MPPSWFPTAERRARLRRFAFWAIVLVSIALLVASPFSDVADEARSVAPWVGAGLLVSEALFIIGLAIIGIAAGIRLPRNPMKWRAHLPDLLAALHRTPLFWTGLVINTVGALGTAVVLILAITRGLPKQSWGLVILPAADLSLTLTIRAGVTSGVRRAALKEDST